MIHSGLDHQLSRHEAYVQGEDGDEHEGGAVVAELGSGLDRLRHAEFRSLACVQGDQERADQGADRDRDERPPEGEADADGDPAENDVEDVHVGAEPEKELLPWLPVARVGGDVLDVTVLDPPALVLVDRHGCGHCLLILLFC
jgi:hypothetical protein